MKKISRTYLKISLFNRISLFILLCSIVSCQKEASELSVSEVFGTDMVLQQNQEIPIWGAANSGTKITVQLNNDTKSTTTDISGNWKLFLPKQQLGEPRTLTIQTHDTTIVYNNILIGEVWLASGQSNMHLDMSRTLNGKENALKANNPNIRIYNMKPTYPTAKGGIHTLEELDKINKNQYFNTNGWVAANPNSIKNFSAVAYYFAEKLQKELNVPVGIIHNAVPGSPTESWIANNALKHDKDLSELTTRNWKENEKNGVGKVLLDIAKNQVSLSNDSLQKHPWMPSYCYNNGIKPILGFPVKGIIWYQGESNSGNIKLHERLLKKMVGSWRNVWQREDLPFYYVQLTSREDRPTWPAFRDSQRRLLDEIRNSGMVVITDVGDRQDTHAKRKKPVGERLALLALGETYQKTDVYESPLFDKVTLLNNRLYISFKGATKGLKTNDSREIRGFEIALDSVFYDVQASTIGEKIAIKIPSDLKKKPVVRYAWKPYTDSNLVNKIGLPVSTFISKKTYE